MSRPCEWVVDAIRWLGITDVTLTHADVSRDSYTLKVRDPSVPALADKWWIVISSRGSEMEVLLRNVDTVMSALTPKDAESTYTLVRRLLAGWRTFHAEDACLPE